MIKLDKHILGTWSFGNDKWWGFQDDRSSLKVLDLAIELGIKCFDTAPAYGRGHSEELLGRFIRDRGIREDVSLMSKFGLRFDGRTVAHDLSKKQLQFEIDQSRKRLATDYLDVYFAHWPDPDTRVEDLAENLYKYYQRGTIKYVGLSNFCKEDIELFLKYCPLHIIQSPYSMWRRTNEELFSFAIENDIRVSVYSPLERGVLTGKFFSNEMKIPKDLNRKYHEELKEENFAKNKSCVEGLGRLAQSLGISLTQLVIAWTKAQPCLNSVILGSRNVEQLKENHQAFSVVLDENTLSTIDKTLQERNEK